MLLMKRRFKLFLICGAIFLLFGYFFIKEGSSNLLPAQVRAVCLDHLKNLDGFKTTYEDEEDTVSLEKEIKRLGLYEYPQELKGHTFDVRGISANISSKITSELVYSFSPSTEEMFASKVVDPNHEQKIFANSPAMIWHKDRFIVMMRMWLDKEETLKKVQNTFSDNYFFMRQFTQAMEPLDKNGRVLGMPTRVREAVGDGPIEPRLFPFYNMTFISFNSGIKIDNKFVDTTMFWNFDEETFVMPEVIDGQPQLGQPKSVPRDKHWSPYMYRNEVYLIYSLDPLRILKCDQEAKCQFFQNAAPPGYVFDDAHDCLRGGTPTIQYSDNYYITISHSTLFRVKPDWKRYYTIHLLVLKTGRDKHQLIYISEPIKFHPDLMLKTPIVRNKYILDPFFFPVSLLKENEDSIVIGGHINDHSSYLFRVRGMKTLMDKIIRSSQTLSSDGPGVGFLHRLDRQLVTSFSGYSFMDK